VYERDTNLLAFTTEHAFLQSRHLVENSERRRLTNRWPGWDSPYFYGGKSLLVLTTSRCRTEHGNRMGDEGKAVCIAQSPAALVRTANHAHGTLLGRCGRNPPRFIFASNLLVVVRPLGPWRVSH
jgi:hypothetical protein